MNNVPNDAPTPRPSERAVAETLRAAKHDYIDNGQGRCVTCNRVGHRESPDGPLVHPRRPTVPEGGPDHPFADGVVRVTANWDGSWSLVCWTPAAGQVPHNLTERDRNVIDDLLMQLRLTVYRAQYRAAQQSRGGS